MSAKLSKNRKLTLVFGIAAMATSSILVFSEASSNEVWTLIFMAAMCFICTLFFFLDLDSKVKTVEQQNSIDTVKKAILTIGVIYPFVIGAGVVSAMLKVDGTLSGLIYGSFVMVGYFTSSFIFYSFSKNKEKSNSAIEQAKLVLILVGIFATSYFVIAGLTGISDPNLQVTLSASIAAVITTTFMLLRKNQLMQNKS